MGARLVSQNNLTPNTAAKCGFQAALTDTCRRASYWAPGADSSFDFDTFCSFLKKIADEVDAEERNYSIRNMEVLN